MSRPLEKRRIAKGLIIVSRVGRPNGRSERFLRIGEFGLSLRQRGRDRPDRFTGPLRCFPPDQEPEDQS